jgi:dGTPase
MDWADDITYAVHDVEDFYRAGLIPLHEYPRAERADLVGFCARIEKRWDEVPGRSPLNRAETERAVDATVRAAPFRAPFDGKLYARATLRDWTSSLIGRYVQSTRVKGFVLVRPRNLEAEIAVLKELTKLHVVEDPSLQTQQFGQRRVIRELFWTYFRSLRRGDGSAFPGRVAEEVGELIDGVSSDPARARFVADLIASMTEEQALKTHRRLTGIDLGPLKDPAVI